MVVGCQGGARVCRSGSHTRPFGALPSRGRGAMTVPSGAGLLSQFFERGTKAGSG